MTFLIVLGGTAVIISAVVGYVAWRDRRSRRSYIDPLVSRDALVQVNRQAVQGRLAEAGTFGTDILRYGPESRSRIGHP
jgi:hypothetical protein